LPARGVSCIAPAAPGRPGRTGKERRPAGRGPRRSARANRRRAAKQTDARRLDRRRGYETRRRTTKSRSTEWGLLLPLLRAYPRLVTVATPRSCALRCPPPVDAAALSRIRASERTRSALARHGGAARGQQGRARLRARRHRAGTLTDAPPCLISPPLRTFLTCRLRRT
jgi:hypothetical protein